MTSLRCNPSCFQKASHQDRKADCSKFHRLLSYSRLHATYTVCRLDTPKTERQRIMSVQDRERLLQANTTLKTTLMPFLLPFPLFLHPRHRLGSMTRIRRNLRFMAATIPNHLNMSSCAKEIGRGLPREQRENKPQVESVCFRPPAVLWCPETAQRRSNFSQGCDS